MALQTNFLLIVYLAFVFCAREVMFVGRKIVCKDYNPEIYYNVTCGIKMVNRYKQLYSMNYSFKPITIDSMHV